MSRWHEQSDPRRGDPLYRVTDDEVNPQPKSEGFFAEVERLLRSAFGRPR